ncbi:MAG TPA: MBL fold metallo-hydrolase [Rhizomicrobium sp.]|nr:MBL fold metallo-hydrolase [Rhizomicrobium sp.]
MTPIPFDRSFEAPYGERMEVSPLISRVLAPNPGPFTFQGTGVYIVGTHDVAVIDPGPDIPAHLDALKAALQHTCVTHILLTHTHNDHSPAAAPLKAWSGAKTYAYGPHPRRAEQDVKVEEGGDLAFEPDILVRDGDVISGDGFTIECVYTPGHTSNHMCYALREEKALFTGDHVMGWSTTVVAPPDGDMAAYRASVTKLLARDDSILWPTHGGPIRDPKPFLEAYLAHRAEREAQILVCLRDGISTIPEIVARLYVDLDKRLYPAAGMSVLAHLIELVQQGRVVADPTALAGASYRMAV